MIVATQASFGHIADTRLQGAQFSAQQTGNYSYSAISGLTGQTGSGVSLGAGLRGGVTASQFGFNNQQAFGRVGAGISSFSQASGADTGTTAGLYQALMSTGRSEAETQRVMANFSRTNKHFGINGGVSASVALGAVNSSQGALITNPAAAGALLKLAPALTSALGSPQAAQEVLTLIGAAAGPMSSPGWGDAIRRLTLIGVSMSAVEKLKQGDTGPIIHAMQQFGRNIQANGSHNAELMIGARAGQAGLAICPSRRPVLIFRERRSSLRS